uniref:Uncharacterized protein n=1 Tax=Gadus morhua TaxID=8049 RepID=A0A8C5C4K8_GADMO
MPLQPLFCIVLCLNVFSCTYISFAVPRNYGGVYVGLPTDLTTVASSQSKPTRKGRPNLTQCC